MQSAVEMWNQKNHVVYYMNIINANLQSFKNIERVKCQKNIYIYTFQTIPQSSNGGKAPQSILQGHGNRNSLVLA